MVAVTIVDGVSELQLMATGGVDQVGIRMSSGAAGSIQVNSLPLTFKLIFKFTVGYVCG